MELKRVEEHLAQRVRALYHAGASLEEMADTLGYSTTHTRRIMRHIDGIGSLQARDAARRAERARRLRQRGVKIRHIAEREGVTPTTIWGDLRRLREQS